MEIKMTKSKLSDFLAPYAAALKIYNKFTIVNDIIDPTPSESLLDADDEIFGAHRLRHPFELDSGIVYNSVPGLDQLISYIKNTKGIKEIYVEYDIHGIYVRLGGEIHTLAISNGLDTGYTTKFDDILHKYLPEDLRHSFTPQQLTDCYDGYVITLNHLEYGPVRLSRNNFPFHGTPKSRITNLVNYIGDYAFGIYNKEFNEYYIALHILYKHYEAFHWYVYIPYE